MRTFVSGLLGLALGALLAACTSEPTGTNFDYLRSPSLFAADTTLTDHPLCDSANPIGAADACRKVSKYMLTWQRPEDTVNFQGYRIYLDTAPENKQWSTVRDHPEWASVIVNRHPLKDTLVFVFTDAHKTSPDTVGPGRDRILALDSNGRAELGTGRLMFALVPVYTGTRAAGQPQYAYFITSDKQPPDVFNPDYRPLPHGIRIAWERPTDRVSFFNPAMDTGIITRYVLKVGLNGRETPARLQGFNPKLVYYRVGGADSTASVQKVLTRKTGEGQPNMAVYQLPDAHRSAKHTHPDATDSMYVEIGGMFPQDSLIVQLSAVDSAGNCDSLAMPEISLRTTDTTQPSMPKLSIDSLSRNGFTIVWTASRDSVAGPDGRLTEAASPNANIMDYRLRRTLVRAAGEKSTSLDQIDTLVQDSLFPTRDRFRIPVRFLPPGATYHLALYAEDSSGYPSRIDTFNVTTPKVSFAGADSALACPPGFIPIPRGRFVLGDANSTSDDEKPARLAVMAPYCIEPYEHRDSSGQRFVSAVTYDQAEAICEAMNPAFGTKLCSEAEWERACEGPDTVALLHGIQSEDKDPSILQSSCNQATNDSAMAMSFALRNSVCLTTEGVYDMAGNLSEWVRDTYRPDAYARLPAGDTLRLDHAFVLDSLGDSLPHSIRGGNYLKPANAQLAMVQALARCSNRDFPEQVRPVYREDCRSEDKPMLVVIYGPGLNGHRCYAVPDSLLGPDITDLVPAPKDSGSILAFRRGDPHPIPFKFTPDSTLKGLKPQSARFTTKALAVIDIDRVLPLSGPKNTYPDTLDASEFRDTTQAGLEPIFRREVANPAWTVRKTDGKYAVKYLYAYTLTGSKPALPYYASRAIGFRCCSLAVKAPSDSIAANP
jgi:hypothetical protein